MGALFLLLASLGACSPSETDRAPGVEQPIATSVAVTPMFDVAAVAGKSQRDVIGVLGEPSTRGTTRHDGREIPELMFRGDSIAIRFVGGKAEWIDVYPPADVPYEASALRTVGIDAAAAPMEGRGAIRWADGALPGLKSVDVFPNQTGGVHYIYVRVSRDP